MMVERIKRLVHEEFPVLFAVPALLWQTYFLYLPAIALLSYSVVNWTQAGTVPFLTLDHYKALINFTYFQVMLNSLLLATTTAFCCLLVGYPLAHFLAFKAGRFKTIFLVFLILPSWTSFIVQVYSWFFLLKKDRVRSTKNVPIHGFKKAAYNLGRIPKLNRRIFYTSHTSSCWLLLP